MGTIGDRMSNRIKVLTLAYIEEFGRRPEALFVPCCLVPGLVALAEDLCGRLLDEGFVLDSINDLKIRICTGNRLGVGILKESDGTTPIQESLWYRGAELPPEKTH